MFVDFKSLFSFLKQITTNLTLSPRDTFNYIHTLQNLQRYISARTYCSISQSKFEILLISLCPFTENFHAFRRDKKKLVQQANCLAFSIFTVIRFLCLSRSVPSDEASA